MPRASVLEDGTYVEMVFEAEDKREMTLGFDPERLLAFTTHVNELTHEARTRKAASAGHYAVQALPVATAGAQQAEGGSAVILSFRTDNGQVYSFAMPLKDANGLRNEMTSAISAARKQARQTRQ